MLKLKHTARVYQYAQDQSDNFEMNVPSTWSERTDFENQSHSLLFLAIVLPAAALFQATNSDVVE